MKRSSGNRPDFASAVAGLALLLLVVPLLLVLLVLVVLVLVLVLVLLLLLLVLLLLLLLRGMEPDNQLGLPDDGTPSLLTANLSGSEDGTLVYAGHSSIYLTEAGSARQLKLQEDGSVHRACWVSVSGSEKLVAAAQNSVQIWNADGSLLYLCWALPPPSESFGGAYYACSVAAVSPTESIYVGSSAGDLFVFSTAGDMIGYKLTATGHDSAVTALAANDSAAPSMLVSGSASGEIKVWDAFSMSATVQIPGAGFGVTALVLCEGFIIAGFETGARQVEPTRVRVPPQSAAHAV